jgi:hypothetical protein
MRRAQLPIAATRWPFPIVRAACKGRRDASLRRLHPALRPDPRLQVPVGADWVHEIKHVNACVEGASATSDI